MEQELKTLRDKYLLDIVGKTDQEIDTITLQYKQDYVAIQLKYGWVL